MPLIQVTIVEGRDVAAKRALIAELTGAAVRTLGVEPERVRVLLTEIPAAHWAVGGVSKAESGP
jgi:4-oxalocrotonate tautomerase